MIENNLFFNFPHTNQKSYTQAISNIPLFVGCVQAFFYKNMKNNRLATDCYRFLYTTGTLFLEADAPAKQCIFMQIKELEPNRVRSP
jgi:hypothetical protein